MYGMYQFGMWVVIEKESRKLIGRVGFGIADYLDFSEIDMGYLIGEKYRRRGYAENLRPWTDAAWERMRHNASLDEVSGRGRAAILVQHADLRLAPTVKPRFARVQGAGQGWPFDDFQQPVHLTASTSPGAGC